MLGMASPGELTQLQRLDGEQAEVRFLQLMLRHHQAATPMIDFAAQYAPRPPVRQFAQRIAEEQRAESAQLARLLAERGASPLPVQR